MMETANEPAFGNTPEHKDPSIHQEGRPFCAGDRLELQLADGQWIRVSYGWKYKRDNVRVLFADLDDEHRMKLAVRDAKRLRRVS